MRAAIVAFVNSKGGVGSTSLVYHLAWMLENKGVRVVAADLDPQADLTANFLDVSQREALWPQNTDPDRPGRTVYGSLAPLMQGIGDIGEAPVTEITDRLALLPGDLHLSRFEDDLARCWYECLDGSERALRIISALWRLLMAGARQADAEVVLVDVGPHLGAINRSALIAADHIVIPVAPDLHSVQGLQNVGPVLRQWRQQWQDRLRSNHDVAHDLPAGRMQPLGYALLSYGVRLGQPARDYQRWLSAIPSVYRSAVLEVADPPPAIENDPYCLAEVKQNSILLPLSYEAHRPMFALKPADGAFGGYQAAVAAAGATYSALAARILTDLASMPTAVGDEREKLRKNQ